MAGSSWQNSGLTFDDPTRFVDQEETSSLDVIGRDSMSIEWTDEKHSLYITSMEASFVEQLYNSNDSFGWQSRGQGHIRAPSKVKNSRRPDPKPEARNAQSKHFRARGKPDVASSSVQHNDFYMHQPLSLAGDLTYLSEDFSRQFTDQGYNYVPANYIEGSSFATEVNPILFHITQQGKLSDPEFVGNFSYRVAYDLAGNRSNFAVCLYIKASLDSCLEYVRASEEDRTSEPNAGLLVHRVSSA